MRTWHWYSAAPDAIKYYKKKKAAKIRVVEGIEVWRDAYGYCRLIREADGEIYISDTDFLTINYATEQAIEASKDLN